MMDERDSNSLTPITSTSDGTEYVNMSVLSLYQSAEDLLPPDSSNRPQINPSGTTSSNSKMKKVNGEDLIVVQSTSSNTETLPNNNHNHDFCKEYSSLFFADSVKSVDFVLVWDNRDAVMSSASSEEKRTIFERNLQEEGLDLETEKAEAGSALTFIKIHASHEVLCRYSEILKLRMPMKEERRMYHGSKRNLLLLTTKYISQKIPGLKDVHDKTNTLYDNVCSCVDKVMGNIYVDNETFPPKSHRFTAVYSRDKEYLFDMEADDFFTSAIRSRIVDFILDRQKFSDDNSEPFAFGVNRLIQEQVYSAAYPLHDGDLKIPGSQRYILFHQWAAISKCFRYQPLDYIKDYFGVKIGLYFAWLGFYTHMLMPASVVGIICFVYSCLTLYQNEPSEDICTRNFTAKMCPICDYHCDYWDLSETCFHARVTYLFDNPTTVFFAVFMSFWAALFLELWKRYSAEITHRWDLTGFDVQEEHPRPQYLARLSHVERKKLNVITNTEEPYVPFWSVRFPATILSFSIVLLLVLLALVAVLGVVLYRISVLAALTAYGNNSVITSYAIIFTTATAASINLCCIVAFNFMYMYLAEYLTELELLRTQTEFDDSLTLKIYLLQFVNYYASIFYIAFFKGKFVGYPGEYSKILNYRQEECGPGGCLMELCIQLAIIMVGKQAMNTLIEMLWPIFFKWLNTVKVKTGISEEQRESKSPLQWCKDFRLVEWGPRSLFPEYLEMVLQYGFVTIFVAAFPLAPFFALLNNILEMRLDARKLLTYHRRPVTQRVRDIGVWYRILDSIGKLSVITNGFIIAFTTDFIPRILYKWEVSTDNSLKGYLNYSLSTFNTSEFQPGSAPHRTREDVAICRYPDFRHNHSDLNKYEKTAMYWHILAARLAFVVVFENVVAMVMILVRWCIPDVPQVLRDQIRREAYMTNEMIIAQEAIRARSHTRDHSSSAEPSSSSQPIKRKNRPRPNPKLGGVTV